MIIKRKKYISRIKGLRIQKITVLETINQEYRQNLKGKRKRMMSFKRRNKAR